MAKPAATLMIVRESDAQVETLLVQRNPNLRFNGGAWVFPGGGLDAGDWADDVNEEAAARRAAVRETAEETGLRVAHDQLHAFAHWTTPTGYPRRYATWFFMTAISSDGSDSIVVDNSEIVGYQWLTASEALERHRRGELLITPPTFVSLSKLSMFSTVNASVEEFRRTSVAVFNPRPVTTETGRVILYEQDAAYDSDDITIAGNRHRLIMTGDHWEYQYAIEPE